MTQANNTVACSNELITASYSLNLSEMRLLQLAIARARHEQLGLDEKTILVIRVADYASEYAINLSNAYATLKVAADTLFDRYVRFNDINKDTNNERSFKIHWFSVVGYEPKSGFIYLQFTAPVSAHITRLESYFTKYDIKHIAPLTSTYATRLYQYAISHKYAKYNMKPISLVELRRILDVEPEQYKTMSNFKRYVLDIAVNQVNEHTDIKISYEHVKEGRKIVGIHFKCSNKPSPASISATGSFKLNDKQIAMFIPRIAGLQSVQKLAELGEEMPQFQARLARIVNDKKQQEILRPALIEAGFNFKK